MTNILSPTFLFSFIFLSLLSSSKADISGFSIDLIHRDSLDSPFYDPSLTRFDRLRKAVRRSQIRLNQIRSVSKDVPSISSEIISNSGEHLMKISLGTPPVIMFTIVDTGSDLTWVQCAPCIKCYKQKGPLFNPKKSSTYKTYPYESSACHNLRKSHQSPSGICEYEQQYVDQSYTKGDLASETLILSSKGSHEPVYFPRFTFGCGFNNSGTFDENGSGLVGLGGGPSSLVSQLKSLINGKFSYCLTNSYAETPLTGQINFGKNAEVLGTDVATTRIVPNHWTKTYYFLKLEGLSVGKHRIEIPDSPPDAALNLRDIVIDSGATFTILYYPTYNELKKFVQIYMGNKTVHFEGYDLCYRVSDKLSYPKIQAHFTGATIDLKPVNTFIQPEPNVTCLAFDGMWLSTQFFGHIAQIDFLVGYDTIKKTVSFKPTKCGHVSH